MLQRSQPTTKMFPSFSHHDKGKLNENKALLTELVKCQYLIANCIECWLLVSPWRQKGFHQNAFYFPHSLYILYLAITEGPEDLKSVFLSANTSLSNSAVLFHLSGSIHPKFKQTSSGLQVSWNQIFKSETTNKIIFVVDL